MFIIQLVQKWHSLQAAFFHVAILERFYLVEEHLIPLWQPHKFVHIAHHFSKHGLMRLPLNLVV